MTLIQRRSLDENKRQVISKSDYAKLNVDNLNKMSDSEKGNYAIGVSIAEYDQGVRELAKLIEGEGRQDACEVG